MSCNFSADKIEQVKAQKAENWAEELNKGKFEISRATVPCRECSRQEGQKSKQESEKRRL